MKPRAACLPCPLLSRPPLPCSFSMEVKLDVWKVPGTAWSKQSATPERPFMQNTANVENLLGHAATSRWSVSLPHAPWILQSGVPSTLLGNRRGAASSSSSLVSARWLEVVECHVLTSRTLLRCPLVETDGKLMRSM